MLQNKTRFAHMAALFATAALASAPQHRRYVEPTPIHTGPDEEALAKAEAKRQRKQFKALKNARK